MPTFKTDVVRNMEGCMIPCNCILGEATSRSPHLMEGSNAVTNLEFVDILADFVHDASNIVAAIYCFLLAIMGQS